MCQPPSTLIKQARLSKNKCTQCNVCVVPTGCDCIYNCWILRANEHATLKALVFHTVRPTLLRNLCNMVDFPGLDFVRHLWPNCVLLHI